MAIIYIASNFFFVIVPILYCVFFPDQIEMIAVSATLNEWASGIIIQGVFLLCWSIGFLNSQRIKFINQMIKKAAFKVGLGDSELPAVIFILSLSIIGFIMLLQKGYLYYGGTETKLIYSEDTSGGHVYSIFSSFLMPMTLAMAFSRLKFYKRHLKSWHWFSLIMFVIIFTVLLVFTAQRALLLLPIILYWAIGSLNKMSVNLKRSAILALLAIIAVILVGGVLASYRQIFWSYRDADFLHYLYLIGESGNREKDFTEAINNFVVRLDLAQNSGLLYAYAQRNGLAFWRPYLGVITSWIPKFIWHEKPFAGSYDGTYETSPEYILGYLKTGIIGGVNTATRPAAGVMYWHFGSLGLIIGGVLIGAIWRILIEISKPTKSFLGLIAFLMIINQLMIPADNLDKVLLFLSRHFFVLWLLNRFCSFSWKRYL